MVVFRIDNLFLANDMRMDTFPCGAIASMKPVMDGPEDQRLGIKSMSISPFVVSRDILDGKAHRPLIDPSIVVALIEWATKVVASKPTSVDFRE